MTIPAATLKKLRAAAKSASKRAYCVYSDFHVGAAVLTAKGQVISGCNVESASYGLTNCAERNAIGQMVLAGELAFSAIVVYTPTPKPTAPCGACRQVLYEFGPDAEVISVCDGDGVLRSTVAELLPGAFGPRDLE
jgi:cytidine deaminase